MVELIVRYKKNYYCISIASIVILFNKNEKPFILIKNVNRKVHLKWNGKDEIYILKEKFIQNAEPIVDRITGNYHVIRFNSF